MEDFDDELYVFVDSRIEKAIKKDKKHKVISYKFDSVHKGLTESLSEEQKEKLYELIKITYERNEIENLISYKRGFIDGVKMENDI